MPDRATLGEAVDDIKIHGLEQRQATGGTAALAEFQYLWQTYRKLIDNDYLFHSQAHDLLRALLIGQFGDPFRFLDLACGDASLMRETLETMDVAHYHGVDHCAPVLELAANNLRGAPFAVELDHGDLVAAVVERREEVDVVWFGMSLHHFDTATKLEVMQAVRRLIGARGIFVIYEPTMAAHECREQFLSRFCAINGALWSALTQEEWQQVKSHVHAYDQPETASGWITLGRRAGFSRQREIYRSPTDFNRMFLYY